MNAHATNGAYTGWNVNNGAITVASNTVLASGSAPTLMQGRHYKAHVLYNGSGVSENFSIPTGGTASLAAGQTALFFFDTVSGTFIDGGRYSHNQSVIPDKFMFRSFTSSRNEIYVDNFTRENTLILVPEPAAPLLGLLGVLSLVGARRRN